MAKATTKAGAKAKSVKKNKLTIDLGNHDLDDEERFRLLEAVHKAIETELKNKEPQAPKGAASRSAAMKAEASGETAGATITATFRNVNSGLSELTATHNGVEKTIRHTGTLDFTNVQKGEIIMIQGKSLGKAEITIDREADPQEKKFEPGVILFNFFILK